MSNLEQMRPTGTATLSYRPEVDGLRAIAVGLVILSHAGIAPFTGGFIGVDVFFVISGYLITTIIWRELEAGTFSFASFYERRARRLLPTLFLVLLVSSLGAYYVLLPSDAFNFAKSLIAVMGFASNILFVFEGDYFSKHLDHKPLLHTWSLGVEEQYYLLFPLFLLVLWRWRRAWVWPALFILCIASLGLAELMAYFDYASASFYLLPSRGWALLVGALLTLGWKADATKLSQRSLNGIGLLGLLCILGAAIAFDNTTPFPGVYGLIPVLGSAMCIAAAAPGTMTYRCLTQKHMVQLGLMSYSAYLWHQPLFAYMKYRNAGDLPMPEAVVLMVLVLPLSYLSWKFVELPCKPRHGRPALRRFLAGLIFFGGLIVAIGAYGIWSNGWAARFSPAENQVFKQYHEYGAYVRSRFRGLEGREFDKDPATKDVLIVGDSFAQDLVNAIYEAGLEKGLDLSTYYIHARCGVLVGVGEEVDWAVPKSDRGMCRRRRNSEEFLLRLKQAQEVWVASSWKTWMLEYIPQSEQALQQITNARITIFGRKHFGRRDVRDYLQNHSVEDMLAIRPLSADHTKVCEQLPKMLSSKTRYIDVSTLLCDSTESCRNDDGQGSPLSPDGSHLTRAGAKYLGDKLKSVF